MLLLFFLFFPLWLFILQSKSWFYLIMRGTYEIKRRCTCFIYGSLFYYMITVRWVLFVFYADMRLPGYVRTVKMKIKTAKKKTQNNQFAFLFWSNIIVWRLRQPKKNAKWSICFSVLIYLLSPCFKTVIFHLDKIKVYIVAHYSMLTSPNVDIIYKL